MNAFVALVDGVANFAVVNADVQNYLRPIMFSLVGLAGVVSAFFIVQGGIEYMTSSGKPEKLEHAKKILKNALIGLAMVIAAATLTNILTSAYQDTGGGSLEQVPALTTVEPQSDDTSITEVLINAIVGLFKHVIESIGKPFIGALDYFTHSTPLMADNPSVFKLWLAVLGIANALFVVGVALLGFQVMSASSLGFEELEFKQLLPKLIMTFLLMNVSIFAIDALISLSNVMISAIENSFGSVSAWDALTSIVDDAGGYGLAALLIMVVFMTLSAILLVYYVMRIVTLYVGAVLAPMVALLNIIPGFKDFSITATKVYITNVFVLFVHVIILILASSLFTGIRQEGADQPYDPIMSMIIGTASLLALLKTQGIMTQFSYVSTGPRTVRKLSKEFMHGLDHFSRHIKSGDKKGSQDGKPSEGFHPRPYAVVNNYNYPKKVAKTKEGYK